MKLTPFGKLFVVLVVLGVVGYVGYRKFGGQLKTWAGAGEPSHAEPLSKNDFSAFGQGQFADAPRNGNVGQVQSATVSGGKLDRPLRVAINTWAGHAPGIVANGGLTPGAVSSLYKKKYGLDVQFVLIEDPVAKLNAFIKGDVDIMWDTVDSWARESSALAEQNLTGKAIIQEDWSRGGDGIVSLKNIDSIEDLKGKTIASTKFTPSHFLLLYLLNQSGLSVQDRNEIEQKIVYTNEAPLAAAAFKAGKVDAAVTWEPDLSGAVAARPNDAHVLVSTTAATNVIADTLVASTQLLKTAPESVEAFVAGWFDGIELMKEDPAGTNQIVGTALKLAPEDVSGMLSGLKLTPFADNAQFFGLAGPKSYFTQLYNAAFVIWRKKGAVSLAVEAKDHADSRFVAALADKYKDQKVEEAFAFDGKPKANDRAIVNKSLSIHFMTGKSDIMPGSYFTLDALGETMLSFGNTYLKVEGNTDSRGSAHVNRSLSELRAEAVKAYLVKNFGIPEARFVTVGNGAGNPVASNATEDGRALNRRTDIKVILNAQ